MRSLRFGLWLFPVLLAAPFTQAQPRPPHSPPPHAPPPHSPPAGQPGPICSVDTPAGTTCRPRPHVKLPDVGYLQVLPHETNAVVDFLTQKGKVAATTVITQGSAAGGREVARRTDAVSDTHHFDFPNLHACNDYWYSITWDGSEHASGHFRTDAARAISFDVKQIGFDRIEAQMTTSSPTTVSLHIKDLQAVGPHAEERLNLPEGTSHVHSIAFDHPNWDFEIAPACGVPQKKSIRGDVWPPASDYRVAATGLDYPQNREVWWNDGGYEIQGAAHDDKNWYLTAQRGGKEDGSHILKIPANADINSNTRWQSVGVPYGSGHAGDPDFSGGYLFVPLERPDGGGSGVMPSIVLIYDTNLRLVNRITMPRGTGGYSGLAWVAVNPVDGFLYTSYWGDGEGNRLRAFQITRDASGLPRDITLHHEVALKLGALSSTYRGIQGGAFSRMGHFYIASDGDEALAGFDVPTEIVNGVPPVAQQKMRLKVTRSGDYGDKFREEIEGLDVWDRSDGRSPGIGGQLHVTMGHTYNDRWWFKHYEVPAGASRWWH